MVKPVGTAPSFSHIGPSHGSRHTAHTAATQAHEADRVAQIKKAVEDGHYKVDMDKTAHKMAQDLLG
ncbi:flagellar biosynthesis anti-sigma factor FlgM [Helicobacter ailurogastricus]|uniref:Anti-sigma-28 factor FlgM C-terminal domain-containing protein n=1 Tax=Helicobacter ailurogastricus TaxID=1578720 RepID=A0A0K2Y0H9_9HELI|nr:flagellar biosynthesis anti-sigma factor FlgM [Helicobacter ailurogastricus]CRF41425.1 hypothetical protein HAL011_12210 [Helicobacter ailurogastricus]CRF43199.1 hypothetical protein HAL013_14240 [Helicobacter ailurogastricus]CRF43504.1 hypothetical protein HAL09_00460 [Helicobacter ailurogastricus]CRF52796.1 hypothetical protein HAL07_12610 [Helicobacter ailurogastricus]BDQ28258.1 hypothetical protein ASB7_00950 [Helicobacter ailurogastricus]